MPDLTHVRFPRVAGRLPAPAAWAGSAVERGLPALEPPPSGLPARILALAGLEPGAYRRAPLERRTAACLRALKADSELAARRRLDARPDLVPLALSTLLIGVSGFFRDAQVFETLRAEVPPLGGRPRPLRIWSAACANGAELYSVAILLAECGLLEGARLLGTDCRASALEAARAGIFEARELDGVEGPLRDRYFERAGRGWRVAGALRDRTTWRAGDVIRDLPDGPWDLVLCRNLVIYLQPAFARPLLAAIAARLAPGGLLVVGKAERPPLGAGLVPVGRCVYRRDDG